MDVEKKMIANSNILQLVVKAPESLRYLLPCTSCILPNLNKSFTNLSNLLIPYSSKT